MKCCSTEWRKICEVCLAKKSRNPIEIMCELMDLDFCNIHGCEHHTMVAAALLTAYFNTISEANSKGIAGAAVSACDFGNKVPVNLEEALQRLEAKAELKIGGGCDYWKACGAIDGALMFWNVLSEFVSLPDFSPMEIGNAVGSVGGPRCCKRSSYLAIIKTTELVKKYLGVEMELQDIFVCKYSTLNTDCIKEDCPFCV